jgi:hypothetical protein
MYEHDGCREERDRQLEMADHPIRDDGWVGVSGELDGISGVFVSLKSITNYASQRLAGLRPELRITNNIARSQKPEARSQKPQNLNRVSTGR